MMMMIMSLFPLLVVAMIDLVLLRAESVNAFQSSLVSSQYQQQQYQQFQQQYQSKRKSSSLVIQRFMTFEILADVAAAATTTTTGSMETASAAAAATTTSGDIISQLDSFWQNSPYTAAALVCGFKASMADMIAQHQGMVTDATAASATATDSSSSCFGSTTTATTTSSSRNDCTPSSFMSCFHNSNKSIENDSTVSFDDIWDMKRNIAFILYGSLYQGIVHEYTFNHLYPIWFGTSTEINVVIIKVLFNLFIQTTLITLPVAYILKSYIVVVDTPVPEQDICDNKETTITEKITRTAMTKNDNDKDTQQDVFVLPIQLQSAFDKYWYDIQHQGLLWKCFSLWGPVQFITFSIIPEHLRVTFIAFISFFWLIILSSISCNNDNEVTTTTTAAITSQRHDSSTTRPSSLATGTASR